MEVASISLIVVMVGLTLWWVLRPLWTVKPGADLSEIVAPPNLAELRLRREALYEAIQDLAQDLEAGKLAEVDYQALRTKLTGQAAQVLREIDEASAKGLGLTEGADQHLEIEIDALLTQFQSKTQPEVPPQAKAQPDGASPAAASTDCPQCGHHPKPGDVFCAQCGTRLIMAVTE